MTVCSPQIIRWVSQYAVPQERKVRATLRRVGVSDADADDLIQDAYCRLAMLKSIDHIDRPGAYFMQIVKNAWRDSLRRSRVGSPLPQDPRTADGVVLSGLPQVDALMLADVVIDRGYPDYASLPLIPAPFAKNHRVWLDARTAKGRRVERVSAGSRTQVVPRRRGVFELRFVGGDGRVWTGEGETSRAMLADRALWSAEAMPGENHFSLAMVLSCGGFRYFAGGDLSADTHDGAYPWLDTESPVVRAAGRVDVAAANHHGYFDACGPAFVQALDADAYVVPAWHATHPAMATLQRMEGAWAANSKLRDVYVTRLVAESRAINARFLPGLRSSEGHVVVRVRSDGTYRIFVTDSTDEQDRITVASAS